MNTATVSAAKPLEFYYPLSCKEFTTEELLQHMRIPGAIWKKKPAHPRRKAALPGIVRGPAYQTVFFGAAREWANDEEGWEYVKPKRRGQSKKWLGARAAIEH
jgi:hypothetical protein